MAHVTESGWIEVGQRLQDLFKRIQACLVVESSETNLEEIFRRGNDHLLDDIGVERTSLDDQISPKGERHRFWIL
ncbi:MAG TPA: hypothetical protein VL202_21440 [Pararhizobium sp.]|uniref:hypothetical protein n=1 Tax=Pararhizobium sp. TaxID=1977563 RepID=UPI002B921633|nr:hypothetical protein [Pararhizobium sp.]HTO33709.1 hypothetical protein [Pararhizobium sp.]